MFKMSSKKEKYGLFNGDRKLSRRQELQHAVILGLASSITILLVVLVSKQFTLSRNNGQHNLDVRLKTVRAAPLLERNWFGKKNQVASDAAQNVDHELGLLASKYALPTDEIADATFGAQAILRYNHIEVNPYDILIRMEAIDLPGCTLNYMQVLLMYIVERLRIDNNNQAWRLVQKKINKGETS